jgi:hypothetical protein
MRYFLRELRPRLEDMPIAGDENAVMALDVRGRAKAVHLGLEYELRMIKRLRDAEQAHWLKDITLGVQMARPLHNPLSAATCTEGLVTVCVLADRHKHICRNVEEFAAVIQLPFFGRAG